MRSAIARQALRQPGKGLHAVAQLANGVFGGFRLVFQHQGIDQVDHAVNLFQSFTKLHGEISS